jgi:hypothetical protein
MPDLSACVRNKRLFWLGGKRAAVGVRKRRGESPDVLHQQTHQLTTSKGTSRTPALRSPISDLRYLVQPVQVRRTEVLVLKKELPARETDTPAPPTSINQSDAERVRVSTTLRDRESASHREPDTADESGRVEGIDQRPRDAARVPATGLGAGVERDAGGGARAPNSLQAFIGRLKAASSPEAMGAELRVLAAGTRPTTKAVMTKARLRRAHES